MAAGQSAIPAVVTAVLGLLNVSSITSTLGCAVYDHVPQNSAFPYIALQTPIETRDDRFGASGKQVLIFAHVYTSSEQTVGSEQVSTIVSKVCELTDYPAIPASFATAGWSCSGLRPENVTDVGDIMDDGITYKHFVVEIRVWVQPT